MSSTEDHAAPSTETIGSSLFSAVVTFQVKPEMFDDFKAFLHGPQGLGVTRAFAGNRLVQACVDSEDPYTIHFHQLWVAKAAMDAYWAFRAANGLTELGEKLLRGPIKFLTGAVDHTY